MPKQKYVLPINFVELEEYPEFIFLNETQVIQFDIDPVMKLFKGEYCHSLNSEDYYDPELGLIKNRAHGGTMVLWKRSLNEFITVLPVNTPSFLPIHFQPPGSPPSVHISIYLPTSGKESEFMEEITKLRVFIEEAVEKYHGSTVFIRNVNTNHAIRGQILKDLMLTQELTRIPIEHRTYHHFTGSGLFDSNIDIILHSSNDYPDERIRNIYCRVHYPIIESHHDVIVSTFLLPQQTVHQVTCQPAPTIENNRKKIIWSDQQIQEYQELLSDNLTCLRNRWLDPRSRTSVSLLLGLSSDI